MSVFPKNKLKCGLVWPEKFPLSLGPSQMTLGLENSAAFPRKINKCLPLCLIQFQVTFLDAVADCVKWQWYSKVILNPCGYDHRGSITVSQTIPPEDWMVTHIQQQFPALAFIHQYFPTPWICSQYYELCMGKDLNSVQSCAEKHCLRTDWQFSH